MSRPLSGAKGSLLVVLATLLLTGETAIAAPKGDQDIVKTLNKAQGMIRQLSEEKMALEAQLGPMQKELEETKHALEEQSKLAADKTQELQKAQADIQRKAEVIAAHMKNAEVYKNNIEILKQNLQKAIDQGQKLNQELAVTQQDNSLLVGAVKERSEWIDKCTKNNSELIRVNKEMIDNFGNQNFWDALQEAEPITGIASVAKENKLEGYRYNLNSLRVTPWDGGDSPVK